MFGGLGCYCSFGKWHSIRALCVIERWILSILTGAKNGFARVFASLFEFVYFDF